MTARKYHPVCSFPGCGRKHNARGLCGPHGAMQLRGEPLRPLLNRTGPIARPAIDRFADKVALTDSECLGRRSRPTTTSTTCAVTASASTPTTLSQ